MYADPYLRKLAFDAIAARQLPPTEQTTADSVDRPTLAAVTDLPVGTPLEDLCPNVPMCCPASDRGRLAVVKLLRDLGWDPKPGTQLTVMVAPDRPVLWLDGAGPPRQERRCDCNDRDCDTSLPTDRLLANGLRHPERATVDAGMRLRLTGGHLAAIDAATTPVAVAALPELGLLAVTSMTALALRGSLQGVRIPPSAPAPTRP